MDGESPIRGVRPKRLGMTVTIAAVAIAAAIGLVAAMGVLHDKPIASDVADLSEPVPDASYYLDVRVKIVALDLNKETVGLQLECIPKGGDLVDAGGHLKFPVVLTLGVSAAGTEEKKTIPSGEQGAITTIDLDLDGNVAEYPWDRHTTSLWLSAVRQAKGREPDPIPIRLQAHGAWPGLDIDATSLASAWKVEWNGPRRLDIAVARSTITTVVVCFSIVLTWILIASVVGMTLAVAVRGRRVEIRMIAFFGMLLFAMTAFRNSLPGAPPMGTFSDYLAFFWGYAVAIIGIGVVAGLWLWRPPSEDARAPK
ncbi:MAG: DUF4436 family protein [candidate division NC10 bacterium]